MRAAKMRVPIVLLSGFIGWGIAAARQGAAGPAPAQAGPGGARQGNTAPPPPMKLISADVTDGVQIPVKFTCGAAEQAVSPALKWTDAPRGTESFTLIVHDMEPRPRKGVDCILGDF